MISSLHQTEPPTLLTVLSCCTLARAALEHQFPQELPNAEQGYSLSALSFPIYACTKLPPHSVCGFEALGGRLKFHYFCLQHHILLLSERVLSISPSLIVGSLQRKNQFINKEIHLGSIKNISPLICRFPWIEMKRLKILAKENKISQKKKKKQTEDCLQRHSLHSKAKCLFYDLVQKPFQDKEPIYNEAK